MWCAGGSPLSCWVLTVPPSLLPTACFASREGTDGSLLPPLPLFRPEALPLRTRVVVGENYELRDLGGAEAARRRCAAAVAPRRLVTGGRAACGRRRGGWAWAYLQGWCGVCGTARGNSLRTALSCHHRPNTLNSPCASPSTHCMAGHLRPLLPPGPGRRPAPAAPSWRVAASIAAAVGGSRDLPWRPMAVAELTDSEEALTWTTD